MPRRTFERPYVVIVDPFEDEVDLYASYLRDTGHVVKTFDRTADARESMRRHPPDAVITRIRQIGDGPDGLELAAELRGDPATADVPILIITTSVDPGDRLAADQVTHSAFLPLPVTPIELVERLRIELQRRPKV